MSPTQTLAAGTPTTEQYGNFGTTGFTEVAGPASNLAMIVGEAGSGKTSLYRDCPGALILNFDLHSVPKPAPDAAPPLAAVWPVVNHEGRILGTDGKEMRLTWDAVEKLKTRLLLAARNDQPRPRLIVIDTLYPTIKLKKDLYAHEYFSGEAGKGFDDIPGGNITRTAYGRIYDSFVPFLMDLRTAGYGVHILAHLMTFLVPVSEDGESKKPMVRHNVPDKIYERFFPMLEFLAAVELKKVSINEKVGGKMKYGVRHEWRRQLVNLSEKLSEMARSRVGLPDRIDLPASGAWKVFEDAYLAAAGTNTNKET
jgi:hypothetical protein